MKINLAENKTKLEIKSTNKFNKSLKKIAKQQNNLQELKKIIVKLGNLEKLDFKNKNHKLVDDKDYENCFECHVTHDLLLVYKYINNELILLLVNVGSHSELF